MSTPRSYLQAAKVQPWQFSPISVSMDPYLREDFVLEDDSCLSRVTFFWRAWVQEHWKAIGGTVTRILNSSTFCFVFSAVKEAERFLYDRPWFVYGSPLCLDKCHPLGCSSKSLRGKYLGGLE